MRSCGVPSVVFKTPKCTSHLGIGLVLVIAASFVVVLATTTGTSFAAPSEPTGPYDNPVSPVVLSQIDCSLPFRGTRQIDPPPPDPEVDINGLERCIQLGSSDSFQVVASNLVRNERYTVSVESDDDSLQFNSACTTDKRSRSFTATSSTRTLTYSLYGCEWPGGGQITAELEGRLSTDSENQDVFVTEPPPAVAIDGLLSTMTEGNTDSFRGEATYLNSSHSYTVRATTSNGDIGFNSTCSDRLESVAVPARRTSYNAGFTLYACDTVGGTVTVQLRRGSTVVDSDTLYVTVEEPPPAVAIDGLLSTMTEGNTDSFRGEATYLDSSHSYTIRATTSNGDIGFNSTCSDRLESVGVPARRTSYNASFTLYACDTVGGTVTVQLRRGSTVVDSDTQYVTVTVPPPAVEIDGLLSTMTEGNTDSFRGEATYLDSSHSYTIRATTSNGDIGFNSTCSDRLESRTVPSRRTSYNANFTLYACDTVGGTVTVQLRRGSTVVDSDTQYVTVTVLPPAVEIDGLLSTMTEGNTDSFTGEATYLDSSHSYTIRATTSNGDIGFNSTCSNRLESVAVPSRRTSYDASFTLYACDTVGGTVTVQLRRGSTVVDSDTQYVTVTVLPPAVEIDGLLSTMTEGNTDSFRGEATYLDSSHSYTIRATTSNGDIGFNSTCSDRLESVAVPSRRTSYDASFTLYACDTVGGTVRVELRRGSTVVDSDTQYVTVEEPPPPPSGVSARTGDSNDENHSDSVTVSWDNGDGVGHYRLQQRVGRLGSWSTIVNVISASSTSRTNRTVSNLDSGSSYYYRLLAYGDGATYAQDWGDPSASAWVYTRFRFTPDRIGPGDASTNTWEVPDEASGVYLEVDFPDDSDRDDSWGDVLMILGKGLPKHSVGSESDGGLVSGASAGSLLNISVPRNFYDRNPGDVSLTFKRSSSSGPVLARAYRTAVFAAPTAARRGERKDRRLERREPLGQRDRLLGQWRRGGLLPPATEGGKARLLVHHRDSDLRRQHQPHRVQPGSRDQLLLPSAGLRRRHHLRPGVERSLCVRLGLHPVPVHARPDGSGGRQHQHLGGSRRVVRCLPGSGLSRRL